MRRWRRNISSMATFYKDWGFNANPFQSSPLRPDNQGRTLLIGRDAELKEVQIKISNPPKVVILEGANGVGKTSLVNVAAYDLFDIYLRKFDTESYVPCRKAFQISENENLEDFIFGVYFEVAQTLIENTELLRKYKGEMPAKKQIDAWLNSPIIYNLQGSFGLGGFALGAGAGGQQNDTEGFGKSGFRKAVEGWLSQIFSDDQGGGVVCVLDNLELLQTSKAAREAVEKLRDLLLNTQGLRWVLCGSSGITYSILSSPRFSGFYHTPIELKGVVGDLAGKVYDSRIEAFSKRKGDEYLPLLRSDFETLHRLLNRNLRDVLGESDNYCDWIRQSGAKPESDEDKHVSFIAWLDENSTDVFRALQAVIASSAWDVFDRSIKMGGKFSPSQYEEFGYKTPEGLRAQVRILEQNRLLTSLREDSDQRMKSVLVTPKGYLVAYAKAKRIGQQFLPEIYDVT